MCDDEDLFMTAEEERDTMEKAAAEKENNPIKIEFENIITNYNQIEYLLIILSKAVKNEFEQPTIVEIDEYLSILIKYFNQHKLELQKFLKLLPNSKAKLLTLDYKKFKN